MASIAVELQKVKNDIDAGIERTETVRQLLAWFGQLRRGRHVVSDVRLALRQLDLVTVPDFDAIWIDGSVAFRPRSDSVSAVAPVVTTTPSPEMLPDAAPVGESTATTTADIKPDATRAPVRTLENQDPSYSVGKLVAANRPPLSVTPNMQVIEAITLMLMLDYSQLPVMQGERSVKGLFSWKSLGRRLALKCPCETVSDAMEEVRTVSAEASIFQVAELLSRDAVVLVQKSATDAKVIGIVAASDVAEQFGSLGEPFLLIGEIESRVRLLIDGKFTLGDLATVKDPEDTDRQINSVADLTFGEYVRLFQNPAMWEKCLLNIDRGVFVKQFEKVREIRNDVMHFDPDGIGPEALHDLRRFATFLSGLAQLSEG